MRVLYLNPDRGIPVLGDKGASVHVRQFIAALASAGHDVMLVAARLGEGNPPPPAAIVEIEPLSDPETIIEEARARGIPAPGSPDKLLRNELVRLAYDRHLSARTVEVVTERGFRPDLVYERHALFHVCGAVVARAFGVCRIVEVNAPLVREQEAFRGLVMKPAAIQAERDSLVSANLIVAVSDEVAAHVETCGVDARRILVAPNGVDTDLFRPAVDRGGARARLGLGAGPVLGFVGSFKPWHGVSFLVEAFAEIARQRPDARLLAIGEGPQLGAARARIADLGLERQVLFTGRLPHADIPAHMEAMDISAAPYDLGGEFYFSPMKVVESLAAGVPVVAVRAGQLASLVDDGNTGLLYPPGDRAAFVHAVLKLMADPVLLGAMAANARERAKGGFSWSALVCRVLEKAARLERERRAA